MKQFDFYLNRFGALNQFISEKPNDDLFQIVVIPSYNEDALLDALRSLAENDACSKGVEVLVVLNSSENDSAEIKELHRKQAKLIEEFNLISGSKRQKYFPILIENIPQKTAGVGYARKVGMDEGIRRFNAVKQEYGIITCFDADCTCSANYLKTIESAFLNNPDLNIASIGFEHALFNKDNRPNTAIIEYELFLHYYKNAFEITGHPQAHFTVGSSMAVRAPAYAKQGGMNKRKAGEDFYFFNKISLLGGVADIPKATVFPSNRESERVPFGTGRAMKNWREQAFEFYPAYDLETFFVLRDFFEMVKENLGNVDVFQKSPKAVQQFIGDDLWQKKWTEIQQNATNQKQCLSRFFQWFDAFMVLKFCHFYRDVYCQSSKVLIESKKLMQHLSISFPEKSESMEILEIFRLKRREGL